MVTFPYAIALILALQFQYNLAAGPSCQNANWWRSFDRRGWSSCPSNTFSYITGFSRSKASRASQDFIYLLEEARCCEASNGFEKKRAVCKQVNWVTSFDRTNTWNNCPTGYFLQGLYRSNGHFLHNIEYGSCCKPQGHPDRYQQCYKENVWDHFNHNDQGMVACSRPGYYITGIYRSTCDLLYCIEEFRCCSMTGSTNACSNNPCLNGGKCSLHGTTFRCTCPASFSGTRCEKIDQATCSSTGDPHYRTFDGKTFNFMGRCQYVLAKDSENTFEVLQKNVPCGNGKVTCANSVTVAAKGLKIHVARGGVVTVFGIVVRLPYNNKGINIIKLGGNTVKITTDIGLTIQYDGVYNVFVTVQGRYKRKTLGLCGNYNGNPNDDFVKQDKNPTGNANEFSNSWKVDRSCPNPPPPPNPCANAGALALEAKKKCALLKLAPFSLCHNSVKQDDGFIQDCEYDVCACKDHPISCLCEEYSAYATTCSMVGVIINWKNLPKFRECVSPCALAPCLNGGVCHNQGHNYRCTCPSSFSGSRCETEAQATCSVTGDPHYRSFDDKTFDFMGECQYVLTKDIEDKFEVLQKNVLCGNRVTCANSLTVTVKGLRIHVARGKQVTVFGIVVKLPYNNRGVNIIMLGGRTVKITTDIGLTVQYDGVINIYVTVRGRYRGKTLGLCGNYNGNPRDDFLKQDNILTGNANEFSDSWKVGRSCPNPPPLPNPCANAGALALEAKTKCALLKLAPFSQCHNSVKQDDGFIQNCEYDVCACKNHPLSCLCEEYAAYATTCSIVGVPIKWRHLPAFKKCSSPCASGPCNNGGTCSNSGKGFKCTCSPGYAGVQCETRLCKNPKALGMESGRIRDSQITASSQWDTNHGPTNGRLNFKASRGKTGAWSARRNDVNQWLQVDFKYPATVTEILTQGRRSYSQWVKTYTVSYSDDAVNFKPYRHGGLVKVFQGNGDRDTIVRQNISPVIIARYIRVHPKSWNNHISMRVEFTGCFDEQPCASGPCLNGGACKKLDAKTFSCACLPGYIGDRCQERICKDPLALGMENGEILDGQITASSQWNANHGPTNGRINVKAGGGKTGAWSSRRNDLNQWLQVDFELQATVTEILIQGRYDLNQWVTSYAVSYSTDGILFNAYQENGIIKIFQANRNRNTIVRQTISRVIVARYIRIHPKSWFAHISMRVDFLGCLREWECEPNPCLNGAICIEYRESYLCSCATGYAGRNCESKQGPCVPQ